MIESCMGRRSRFSLLFWLGGLAWTALSAGAAHAQMPSQGEVVEDVVALVGERPILRSEVEEQFQVLAQQFQIAPGDTASSNQLHRDIVQRMVDDHLLYLEAKSQGIEAPTEEIEAQVQQALQDNKEALGEDGFREELKREGLTLEALESRWRDEATRQALAQRLVQRDVRPKVTVTEDGVRKFYEEHKSELPKRPRAVKIQDLFIQVRPDSAITKAALSRAREIRTKVQGGMSFADAATKLSDDPTSADRGGSLGRVRRGDLTPELEAIAFALPTGVVSEPIQTPYGYNLLQVDDKDPAGQWAEVRIILVEMKATRSDEAAAEERARAARAKIAGGMDFTEAVRKFSEDPPTRAKDGNLGWVAMQGFQGAVYDTVSKLAVGEVSQPTPGDNGYHIFRVLEEEPEREYQFDEIQDEIRQYYYQDELESHLRELLDQLKDKYYIERHDKW